MKGAHKQSLLESRNKSNIYKRGREQQCSVEQSGQVEVRLRGLISRIALGSLLASKCVELETPQIWKQYSIEGRGNPLFNRSNCLEKNFRHLNRTASFWETALAICVKWGFHERSDVMVIPSLYIVLRAGHTEPWKEIGKVWEVLAWERWRK